MRSGLRLHQRHPSPLPWARPRRELLILILVVVATLTPVYPINAQDVARVCLTRSLVHLKLYNDACLGTTFASDRAEYNGHYYSDKAPGMSGLELPGVELARVPNVTDWPYYSRPLWVARVLAGGLAFLLSLFIIGRISEGLAPGYGAPALVAYGLGTLVAPLAATSFEHVTAGALGLAAFALAWGRREHAAGLLAGAALLIAYEELIVVAVLGVYVALRGARALYGFARGVLPGAALLWTYNWLAFGAPWRLSYHYKTGETAPDQRTGFFGIRLPTVHGIQAVFVGESGLLVISPIVVAAAYGLALLARRDRAEAIVCGVIAFAFLILNTGYVAPLGGLSPGPRYLVPGLAFLAVGLGPAFARHFRLTAALTVVSVIAMTAVTLTWPSGQPAGTIWNEIVHLPLDLGSSRLVRSLVENILGRFGLGTSPSAIVVAGAAAAALAVALTTARPATRTPPHRAESQPGSP